jgi:type II secretory pathway component PulJ
MRKGFSLVEILVLILALPIAAIVLDEFFRTIVWEIPRSCYVVQENTTLLNMLTQMQKDISQAVSLPARVAGRTSDEKCLLIELTHGAICYRLKDGQVLREKLTSDSGSEGEDVRVWSAPHGQVEWRVCKSNGKGYAVQVKTHVNQQLRKKQLQKMANSHVYYLGIFE